MSNRSRRTTHRQPPELCNNTSPAVEELDIRGARECMLFILRRHRRRLALHCLCRRDSISRCHYCHQALTYHYGPSDHPLDQTDTPRTCRRKNQSSFDCFIKIKADAAKRVGCFHGDDLFELFIRCRRCRKARWSSRRKRSRPPFPLLPAASWLT